MRKRKNTIRTTKVKNTSGIPAGRAGIPNPIDIHVGERFKQRRTMLGLSQTQVANTLGITFQQIQKYEKGTNRISASRLVDMASILSVDISYFFDNMPKSVLKQSPRLRANLMEDPFKELTDNPMTKRETLTLVRVYYKVTDQKKRRGIINLCRSLAEQND